MLPRQPVPHPRSARHRARLDPPAPHRSVESPDATVPALGELAQFLRDQRGDTPYSVLAERSKWGPTTLKRAASGKQLPTWPCITGYLAACGMTHGSKYERAKELFQLAQAACKRRPGAR